MAWYPDGGTSWLTPSFTSEPMVAQSAAMTSSAGVNLGAMETGGESGQTQRAGTITIRMAQARRLPSSHSRRLRFE